MEKRERLDSVFTAKRKKFIYNQEKTEVVQNFQKRESRCKVKKTIRKMIFCKEVRTHLSNLMISLVVVKVNLEFFITRLVRCNLQA